MEELRKYLEEKIKKGHKCIEVKGSSMCATDIMYIIGVNDTCNEIINYIDNIKNK